MAPLKRKSVEPMAAHLAPTATRARHQSLHHFVADSTWSDEQMLLRVAQWVVPAMDFSDGGWWIVDDVGGSLTMCQIRRFEFFDGFAIVAPAMTSASGRRTGRHCGRRDQTSTWSFER
jgi:hypothetical protein